MVPPLAPPRATTRPPRHTMPCSEDRLFGPHDYEIVYGWSTRSLEVTISARTGPPLRRGDICTIGGRAGAHCKDFVVIELNWRGGFWFARCVAAGEQFF